MKLTLNDLQSLRMVAIQAGIKAANYIEERKNDFFEILIKENQHSMASQVVTEIDIQSQEIILKELNESILQFDLGMLTEESVDDESRLHKEYFWCIDPLDGTLPFTEGRNGYAVSIALVSKAGVSVIGVVVNPVTMDVYSAVKDCGVLVNDKPLVLENTSKNFTWALDQSFCGQVYFGELRDGFLSFIAQTKPTFEILYVKLGAVMNAIAVLENGNGCYFKFPKEKLGGGSIWDFAATACLFNEAGFYVSDVLDNQLNLNDKQSTYLNHCGFVFSTDSCVAKEVIKKSTRSNNETGD